MIGPELNPNTVYRVNGETMLYIRTERERGHLFVKQARRMVFQVWVDKMPPEAELIVDERGRREANEERWLRLAAEHEIGILKGLLTLAGGWLPKERYQELRQRYVEATRAS